MVNHREKFPTVDFPTVHYFFYFSKFFVVYWFRKLFQEKKFWKKGIENFDEKNLIEKNFRKKNLRNKLREIEEGNFGSEQKNLVALGRLIPSNKMFHFSVPLLVALRGNCYGTNCSDWPADGVALSPCCLHNDLPRIPCWKQEILYCITGCMCG